MLCTPDSPNKNGSGKRATKNWATAKMGNGVNGKRKNWATENA